MKKDIEFENQRPDEEVVLFAHQHPWALAKAGFWILILILTGLTGFLIFHAVVVRLIIVGVILLLIVLATVIRQYIFSNTYFILTNERILNIEQNGLFSHKVSEAELKNILTVHYEVKGMMPTLLNFGDINIDTSGSEGNFLVLKSYENPNFIHDKISHLANATDKR